MTDGLSFESQFKGGSESIFFLFSWKMGLNSSKWQLNEIIYERLQNVTFSALIAACYVFVHQSIESLCALPAR